MKTGEFRNCVVCNKEFFRTKWDIEKYASKYCSHKCYWGNKHNPAWNKGKKLPQFSGEKASAWKGENAGYGAKHRWVAINFGKPDTCEKCGKVGLSGKLIHWANISGNYLRDRSDWLRLCASCHHVYDDIASKRIRDALGRFI